MRTWRGHWKRRGAAWIALAASLGCFRLLLGAESLGPPQDCAFVARFDQSTQRYVRLAPVSSDTSTYHLLFVLHGHGADRWQYVRETRGECRAARDIAARFALVLISPDYRATTSWMGPAAEADLVQLIALERASSPKARVFVTGASMGGTAALTFAALHPELVDGVVALNGTANLLEYTNFQSAIEASFGGSKIRIPEEYKRRSAEYWPERLTMPIALTAGGQDTVVPPESVVRLAGILRCLARPVLLLWREDGAHETSYEDSLAAYEFVVRAVFSRGEKH